MHEMHFIACMQDDVAALAQSLRSMPAVTLAPDHVADTLQEYQAAMQRAAVLCCNLSMLLRKLNTLPAQTPASTQSALAQGAVSSGMANRSGQPASTPSVVDKLAQALRRPVLSSERPAQVAPDAEIAGQSEGEELMELLSLLQACISGRLKQCVRSWMLCRLIAMLRAASAIQVSCQRCYLLMRNISAVVCTCSCAVLHLRAAASACSPSCTVSLGWQRFALSVAVHAGAPVTVTNAGCASPWV